MRRNGKDNCRNNGNTSGPPPKKMVDGLEVEGRGYKQHEWQKLTRNQKRVVRELQQQRKDKANNPTAQVKAVNKNEIEDLVNSTIVASLKKVEERMDAALDDSNGNPDDGNNNTNKRKVKTMANEVGNFLKRRKSTGDKP